MHHAGRRHVVVPARGAIVEWQDGVAREICWNGIGGGISFHRGWRRPLRQCRRRGRPEAFCGLRPNCTGPRSGNGASATDSFPPAQRMLPAHGPVEALQIAVENKDEIVEPLPPSKRHGSERFWLVHFSVAHESPHLAILTEIQKLLLGDRSLLC